MRELRIGILGCGFMGETHARRLAQIAGVQVTALCDAESGRARALQERLGLAAAVYDDADCLLDKERLDALYICLPPFAHNGQAERAAARGIHLFLEKPIALNTARAEAIVAAIEQHGVVSQVGYHMRFRKSVARLKTLLDEGRAGQPTLFQGRYWCNMLGAPWWRTKSSSGGQVFEQVIHIYDLALYLLGEPDTVCGFADNLCHQGMADYTIDDTSVSIIRFRNGSMATIAGSNCALPDHYIGDFRVVCEHALLDYRCTGQNWISPDEATLSLHTGDGVKTERIVEDGDVYLAESEDFIAAIRTGRPTRTPAREGLRGVRLVSAVLDSAGHGGHPVAIKEQL